MFSKISLSSFLCPVLKIANGINSCALFRHLSTVGTEVACFASAEVRTALVEGVQKTLFDKAACYKKSSSSSKWAKRWHFFAVSRRSVGMLRSVSETCEGCVGLTRIHEWERTKSQMRPYLLYELPSQCNRLLHIPKICGHCQSCPTQDYVLEKGFAKCSERDLPGLPVFCCLTSKSAALAWWRTHCCFQIWFIELEKYLSGGTCKRLETCLLPMFSLRIFYRMRLIPKEGHADLEGGSI